MFQQIGKTIERKVLDQAVTVTSLAGVPQQIPFQPLKTVGLLRGLTLRSPLAAGTTVPGTGTIVQQAGNQIPQHRQIYRLRLTMQGIAPLYDVDGEDLPFLNYYRRGNAGTPRDASAFGLSVIGADPSANLQPFTFPTGDGSIWASAVGYATYCAYNSGATSIKLSYAQKIPISEQLVFPNTPIAQDPKTVILTDQPMEIGLLFMQTSGQNVQVDAQLNPLYQAGTSRSPLLVTGNATASIANQSWQIQSDYYKIPSDPADMPNDFQMAYAVQCTTRDTAVAGQQCTISHRAAGLLLKTIYIAYNDATDLGTLVDLTAAATSNLTTLQLDDGASTIRRRETADLNAFNAFSHYYAPPPGSCAFDLVEDGTWTQALDTGKLVNVETTITNLPASVTRIHTIEVRLIPVQAGA